MMASVSSRDMNQWAVSTSALIKLPPRRPPTGIGESGTTTTSVPNRSFNHFLLRTQSKQYWAVPTDARCDTEPMQITVPVHTLLGSMLSVMASVTSRKVPPSTLTTRRHSPPDEPTGAHAGNAWSAATYATGPPPLDLDASCGPVRHDVHLPVDMSKLRDVFVRNARLHANFDLVILSSPLTAKDPVLTVSVVHW